MENLGRDIKGRFVKGWVPKSKGIIKTADVTREKLEDMYFTNRMSQSKISEIYGVSQVTISNWFRLLGIRSRSDSERATGELNPFYGKTHTKQTIRRIREKNPYMRGGMRGERNPFYGHTHTRETLKKILHHRNQRPNKSEEKLIKIMCEGNFPFKYTGDGDVVIGGRVPDFLDVNGQKKVVELFGRGWHKPGYGPFNVRLSATEQATKRHYNRYGFDCLIIWDNELINKEDLLSKISSFCGIGPNG